MGPLLKVRTLPVLLTGTLARLPTSSSSFFLVPRRFTSPVPLPWPVQLAFSAVHFSPPPPWAIYGLHVASFFC